MGTHEGQTQAYRMFIKIGTKDQLDALGKSGAGGFKKVELLITSNFDLVVPEWEKPFWVELKYAQVMQQADVCVSKT